MKNLLVNELLRSMVCVNRIMQIVITSVNLRVWSMIQKHIDTAQRNKSKYFLCLYKQFWLFFGYSLLKRELFVLGIFAWNCTHPFVWPQLIKSWRICNHWLPLALDMQTKMSNFCWSCLDYVFIQKLLTLMDPFCPCMFSRKEGRHSPNGQSAKWGMSWPITI